jgi:CBS domain-containing protein
MRASDVMTTNVITVSPATTVQDLAALLGSHGISGVPVVDSVGNLVGIVSEGDLLFRAEMQVQRRTVPRRPRWFDALGGEWDSAQNYVKSHGRTVGDVMTRDVETVLETTGLDEVASMLETKRVKRVPVLRDRKVVGIISRANLVRALAATGPKPATDTDTDDRRIRDAFLAELRGKAWARIWAEDIIVRDKVVHIWCSDDRPEAERRALRIAAENTSGVLGVEEHLVPVPIIPMV